jgi:hypothetical protein
MPPVIARTISIIARELLGEHLRATSHAWRTSPKLGATSRVALSETLASLPPSGSTRIAPSDDPDHPVTC